MLPAKFTTEIIEFLSGTCPSTGTVMIFVKEAREFLELVWKRIAEALLQPPKHVDSDESGCMCW